MCLSTEKYYLIWHNYQAAKKHKTPQNYQSCFCAKAMQAIVCGNKLPGSAKQANKDFTTSVVQKARPAFSVSRRNISVPRAFSTAEERKRVLPSGRATTSPRPAVKGPITGINPAWPFFMPLSLWGKGWPLLAVALWTFKFSGAYTAEKPWTKIACNNFLCQHSYSHDPTMAVNTLIHVTKNYCLD